MKSFIESGIMNSMNRRFSYLTLVSILYASNSFAEQECWNESKACSLAGSLELHTYPSGRSNSKGEDELETQLYLKLDPPVTVHFKDFENNDKAATELVTLMEIAGEFPIRLFKTAKGKNHATVKAPIFGQQTGHHHTHFLISVDNNIVLDKK